MMQTADKQSLLTWFSEHARDLPWRKEPRTAYRVWLSEIMLQQTRVDTVLPYYSAFLKRYPGLEDLAQAEDQEVMALWAGLGYYRRARMMLRCARELVEVHNGVFPRDKKQLAKLPGFGPYTSAAVGSLAFALPLAVLDGNVERVLARLFCVEEEINRPATKRHLQELADNLLDVGQPGRWNEALMELGALVCLPARPFCESCPLSNTCEAAAKGLQNTLPRKSPRKKVPEFPVLLFYITDEQGRVLAQPPGPDEGMLQGLWQLPSIKGPALHFVEKEKVSLDKVVWNRLSCSLRKELQPKLRGKLHMLGEAWGFTHVYSHFKARVRVESWLLASEALSEEKPGYGSSAPHWLHVESLKERGFSSRDQKVLDKLNASGQKGNK